MHKKECTLGKLACLRIHSTAAKEGLLNEMTNCSPEEKKSIELTRILALALFMWVFQRELSQIRKLSNAALANNNYCSTTTVLVCKVCSAVCPKYRRMV